MPKYLHRPEASYHILEGDSTTAKCGAATAGKTNYEIVERENPPMRALICSNCLGGFSVGTRNK